MDAAGQKRDLTDQQRRAIFARDCSVALSAGAGCGKTFTLVQRYLSHVAPDGDDAGDGRGLRGVIRGASLASLIAITFTERAAREMRERVEQACRARLLLAADDASAGRWLDLLRELEAARVSTIHSFCAALLRAHAVEAGLDPQFQVLEEAQAATLRAEIIDDQLRRQLIDSTAPARPLAVMFGLESLHGMIAALLRCRHEINFERWIAAGPDELVERWRQYHAERILPRALWKVSESAAARSLLKLIDACRPTHPAMSNRCQTLARLLPALSESRSPLVDLEEIQQAAKVQGGGGKSAWPSEQDYHGFRDAATELRETIAAALKTAKFDPEQARTSAVAGLQLLESARPAAAAYRQRKTELGLLDFDDLLHRTRELLEHPRHADLRRRLSESIELLLVDEFQDTDPLQVNVVQALTGSVRTSSKLFIVGDLKQSIYRFRGAAPQVFRDLAKAMPAAGRMALTLNFRSQPAILDFVNALFCDEFGEDYEALVPSRPQLTTPPAIEFLWASPPPAQPAEGDNAPPAKPSVADLRKLEADWIARRLRAMFDGGEAIVADKNAHGAAIVRPPRPGDVAILFRALSDVDLYEDALERYDIPYYVVGGKAFYSQQEVYDLLNLLRAVADPADEVSLAGVLRSPFFSLADETLFWLVEHGRRLRSDGALAAGLFAPTPPAELDDAQRRRVRFAAQTVRELRQVKDRLPVADLVNLALARTGYDAILLAEFLGERKLANLYKLVEQARAVDRSGIFSLSDFLTQLAQFVADQPDEALAATQRETSDVVRLMTIHKSKGLEFPVVVVPDLERRGQASRTNVAFDPDLGPLVAARDGEGEPLFGGLTLYKFLEAEEDAAEATRLFYVAATRAADYLLLSSGVEQAGQPKGPWRELLARRFDLETGELKAELPEGVGVPQIRVTLDEPPLAVPPSARTRQEALSKAVEQFGQLSASGGGQTRPSVAPIAPDATARRWFSFSRLSGVLRAGEAETHDEDETQPSGPASRGDALALGTLVHAVLAQIDFGSPGDIAAQVRRHAAAIPDRSEADTLAPEAIDMLARFVRSARAKELAAARELHAELEFLLSWPPDGATGAAGADAGPSRCLLEGVIDCLYQDAAGHWHVLDYKTNRVTADGVPKTAAAYEMQMLLYGLAVERILGAPPASLVLHFLRLGVEHRFQWSAASRAKAIELVDRGLAAIA